MAATSKQALIDVTIKEFEKLEALIAKVDELDALASDDDGSSIKDVVGHRGHWIGLFLGWYHDGLSGKQVFFPAEGYKWNDLKRYNADLRAAQADLDWAQVCSRLREAHQDLIDFITEHSQSDLYDVPMAGANNPWTPGRWAEAAGPSHYRSAAKYIRSRLKALTSA